MSVYSVYLELYTLVEDKRGAKILNCQLSGHKCDVIDTFIITIILYLNLCQLYDITLAVVLIIVRSNT